MAQITQSGAAISGTLTLGQSPCTFHGTLSGAAISWAQDAQQASFLCRLALPAVCVDQRGNVNIYFIGDRTITIAGTVSGSQIAASGGATSNILDPSTGNPIGTVQASVQLTLQRQ
jgi:hypothetical protein